MKLAQWLTENEIKRKDFAERIGVSPSMITALCDGSVWPGRHVAGRIAEATGGSVTADSFLASRDSEDAA